MSKLVVCSLVHAGQGSKNSDQVSTVAKVDTWAEANSIRRSILQGTNSATPVVYDERGNMLAVGFHRI